MGSNYTVGLYRQWLTIDAPDPREASGVRSMDFGGKPIFYLYLYLYLSNVVRLKGDWQLELDTNVATSGYQQNILTTNTYFDLKAAVQKAFLCDKSLVVRLSASNLAGLANYNCKTDFGAVFINQKNIYDNRRITLSIRYSFNTTNVIGLRVA